MLQVAIALALKEVGIISKCNITFSKVPWSFNSPACNWLVQDNEYLVSIVNIDVLILWYIYMNIVIWTQTCEPYDYMLQHNVVFSFSSFMLDKTVDKTLSICVMLQ